MKTIVVSSVLSFIISLSINSQVPLNEEPFRKQNQLLPGKDTRERILENLEDKSGTPELEFSLPNLPDLKIKDNQLYKIPRPGNPSDNMFPGSDNFYAKREYWIPPSEKSFAIKPDTTKKYYLLIKDPLTGKVYNR